MGKRKEGEEGKLKDSGAKRGGGGGGGGERIGESKGGKRMSKKMGGGEDVKRREDGMKKKSHLYRSQVTRYLLVDDGVEDDPGETIVLEWGELGGLVEDEHRGHLRC